jgi:tetratricopeptide (TPR) repeat protein
VYLKQVKRVATKRSRVQLRTARRARVHRARTAAHSNGASHKTHPTRHVARKPARRTHKGVLREAVVVDAKRTDPQYLVAVKSFEAGVRHFRAERFAKARQMFEKLSTSTYPEVADRARLHLRLCEQRRSRPLPSPKSAQDYYVLGVAELNARQLESALGHLSRADRLEPNGGHIRYALAAAHALQGNTEAALEHLKAAIILEPHNSFQARDDEDFRALTSDVRFRSLVGLNGSHPAETTP